MNSDNRYRFHYCLSWFPWQPCISCGKWYWGGLPFKGWRAAYQTYCSQKCHADCEY